MHINKTLAFLLAIVMALQLLTGCANKEPSLSGHQNEYAETIIEEEYYRPSTISEDNISEKLIKENLIYEDSCYELRIDEQTICEAYTIETVVGANTEEYIRSQLPDGFENYDIDWQRVIGKFAAGTAIIVVVGVVAHFTKGATYYFFASPLQVASDAVVGGAMFAAFNVVKNTKEGHLPKAALKKYAIEGFADGYMWGAISSVSSTVLRNLKLPQKLKFADGTIGKIKLNGSVVDEAGNVLGNAYLGEKGIFVAEEGGKIVKNVFTLKGKELISAEILTIAKMTAGKLPANTLLQLGTGASAKTCLTDATGNIFKVDGELLPNIKYILKGITYETDELGRIVKVTFTQLTKKNHARLPIENTMEEIGRGFQKVGDDRGHLIGDQFGGDNTLANIVPMNYRLNRGAYKEMETKWAEAIVNGENVSGTIEILYDAASFRPSSFEIAYSIGSKLFNLVFQNV